MKKKLVILSVICLLLLSALLVVPTIQSVSAEGEANHTITVMGSSSISLVPDLATVSVGVETSNENLLTAEKENAGKVKKVIDTLLSFGVQEDKIKTKNFSVYQQYDYNNGTRKHIGYQISNIIEYETDELNKIGTMVSALIENGANQFNGVSFSVKNSDEAYLQALQAALANAEDKAKHLISNSAQLSIVKIVEENIYSVRPMYDSVAFAKTMSEEMPIMKGEISLKANLKVVFSYTV
jgi:uncharacterized protein YggE